MAEKETMEELEEEQELKDQVISIRRTTKVVKGGKNLSFSALVAVGNENGMVGIGMGKAREVPPAIAKGVQDAKKNMIDVPLKETTIPHFIKGIHGGGEVVLRPASKGTGVIAGGAVRIIMERPNGKVSFGAPDRHFNRKGPGHPCEPGSVYQLPPRHRPNHLF